MFYAVFLIVFYKMYFWLYFVTFAVDNWAAVGIYFESITAQEAGGIDESVPKADFLPEASAAKKLHFFTLFLQQLCTLYSCKQLKHSLDTKY